MQVRPCVEEAPLRLAPGPGGSTPRLDRLPNDRRLSRRPAPGVWFCRAAFTRLPDPFCRGWARRTPAEGVPQPGPKILQPCAVGARLSLNSPRWGDSLSTCRSSLQACRQVLLLLSSIPPSSAAPARAQFRQSLPPHIARRRPAYCFPLGYSSVPALSSSAPASEALSITFDSQRCFPFGSVTSL